MDKHTNHATLHNSSYIMHATAGFFNIEHYSIEDITVHVTMNIDVYSTVI